MAGLFAPMTSLDLDASIWLDGTRLLGRIRCAQRARGTPSQREKVTGPAFDRQIDSKNGGIAMQTAGSGPDSPSTAVLATLAVTVRGHLGFLG